MGLIRSAEVVIVMSLSEPDLTVHCRLSTRVYRIDYRSKRMENRFGASLYAPGADGANSLRVLRAGGDVVSERSVHLGRWLG